MPKLVSVVTATYNSSAFLPLAIQSALDQTYRSLEIHVVDDGSTDATRQALEPFLEDPRVKYHYQCNQGPASARNNGIRESKGEFIAFLDADDLWMPEKLERQLPLFEKSASIGVVYSPVTNINEAGNVIPTPKVERHRGWVTDRLLVENFVPCVTAVARRECFERLGAFDESLVHSEDYELWLRFSTKYEFDYLEEPTALYRVSSQQLSNNYMKRFECMTGVMKRFVSEHPNLIDEKTLNEALAVAYANRGYGSARVRSRQIDALRDFIAALRFRPTYSLPWKELLKLPLRSLSGHSLSKTT